MKNLLILFLLNSFFGFSQKENLQDFLKFTDSIKDNTKREIEIRKTLDYSIIKKLNNLREKVDTIRLIYDVKINKIGQLILIEKSNEDKKINTEINNIFIDTLKVKPFKDEDGKIYIGSLTHYTKYGKNSNGNFKWVLPIFKFPVFPGCKGNNDELSKCMSHGIRKHINRKFNTSLAQDLGLSGGKKRILVQFNINKEGLVSNIKARAPHPRLEKEGIRIFNLLPKMISGKQDNEPIKIKYSIPIVFNIEDTVLPDKIKEK